MNKKSINETIDAKTQAFVDELNNSDEVVQNFFLAEIKESEGRTLQMDIIKDNIGTLQGRAHLAKIGQLKLDHQGKEKADSFVRHIAKLVREGVIKEPMKGGKPQSLKNSKKKGVIWSDKTVRPTTDKPKADNKPEQVDKAKVKAEILKLLAKLPLADRVVMVNELSADVGADKAVATLGGAGAKPKAKKVA